MPLDLKEVIHYGVHVVVMPVAVWLWNERRVLKEVLEDGLERRHEPMINPLELPKDLAILISVATKLQASLPLIQKNMQDISQAIADQKNPVALVNDVNTLLQDLSADLAALSTILPKTTPTPAAS